MRNWRWWFLGMLFLAPFIFLMGVGAYALWWSGWFFWVWWPLAGCLGLALFLSWRWQRAQRLLTLGLPPSLHWSERDKLAWQLVEKRAGEVTAVSMEQLASFDFYVATGEKLALDLARLYHPRAADPLGSLTILEILAVIELAAHDLAAVVEKYLPGSHFLTVSGWRNAQKAVGWYQKFSKWGWALAGLFNPISTGARYLASQMGVTKPWQKLQTNLQLWFFHAFLQRLGSYLVELYAGRLRVGAERYRQYFGTPSVPKEEKAGSQALSLVLVGQSKSGKSSLINAFLGERRAATDVVEATTQISRYQLRAPGSEDKLTLWDTVGYAHEGPKQDQLRATEEAIRNADAILLVLHARNPARQADLELLGRLSEHFAAHPELKRPPILGVLTHIDLLSPSLEWSPPYNWTDPRRAKEIQISQAVAAVEEELGEHLAGVAPVCAAPGKEYGIQEGLLPTLTTLLEEARAVALVRCLRGESDSGQVKKALVQLLSVGGELLKVWLQPAKT